MAMHMILASGSPVRAQLLRQAAVKFSVVPAKIDEEMLRDSLLAESAPPRDVADKLAEMKAVKVSDKNPGTLVLGCDQVLDFQGKLLSKPLTQADAIEQLTAMRDSRHTLLSAAVLCQNGKPIWRHIGEVRMHMRTLSDTYIQSYVDRNWESIRQAVGAYKLEEEGVRLFSRIEGDYFHVLGMPLLELLTFLTQRGDLDA